MKPRHAFGTASALIAVMLMVCSYSATPQDADEQDEITSPVLLHTIIVYESAENKPWFTLFGTTVDRTYGGGEFVMTDKDTPARDMAVAKVMAEAKGETLPVLFLLDEELATAYKGRLPQTPDEYEALIRSIKGA